MTKIYSYKIEFIAGGSFFECKGVTFGDNLAEATSRVFEDYDVGNDEDNRVYYISCEEVSGEDETCYEITREEI